MHTEILLYRLGGAKQRFRFVGMGLEIEVFTFIISYVLRLTSYLFRIIPDHIEYGLPAYRAERITEPVHLASLHRAVNSFACIHTSFKRSKYTIIFLGSRGGYWRTRFDHLFPFFRKIDQCRYIWLYGFIFHIDVTYILKLLIMCKLILY